MNISTLSESVSVSGQIAPSDVGDLVELGFASIICNRPDREADDQPDFETVAGRARDAGLQSRYVPVVSGRIDDADVLAFRAALEELPSPVLVYCRTGTRSRILHELAIADDTGRGAVTS